MGVEPAATRPAKLRATHPAKPSATLRRTPAATRPAKRHGPVRPDGVQPACSWAGKHPPPRATGSLRPPPAASGGAGVSYPSAYTETTPDTTLETTGQPPPSHPRAPSDPRDGSARNSSAAPERSRSTPFHGVPGWSGCKHLSNHPARAPVAPPLPSRPPSADQRCGLQRCGLRQ